MAPAETPGSRERAAALVVLAVAGAMLGTIAQGAASAGAGPSPRAGSPGLGWIPDVAVSGVTQTAYNPAIATAPNGDLYAAWITVVGGGKGQVEFARSGDGGLTWGSSALVAGPSDNNVWPRIRRRRRSDMVWRTKSL